MRSKDKFIFQEAAAYLNLWILVRSTNNESLPFIGSPGYKPKRIDCKAKTADYNYGNYRVAGLVANPHIHAEAFKASKLTGAKYLWGQMKHLIGSVYQVNANRSSPHYGCLTINGNHIHGDYDLYDIINPEQPEKNLGLVSRTHDTQHIIGLYTKKVQEYVNNRIGSPMIQHSGNAQFADHSGQSKIEVFGPAGEQFTILNEYSLKAIYETIFNKRKTLAEKY